MAIVISEKVDFRTRKITEDTRRYFKIMKGQYIKKK